MKGGLKKHTFASIHTYLAAVSNSFKVNSHRATAVKVNLAQVFIPAFWRETAIRHNTFNILFCSKK